MKDIQYSPMFLHIDRVEEMLVKSGVEISRLDLSADDFNEEVVYCLDHQMTDREMVEHFNDLIDEANDLPNRYMV